MESEQQNRHYQYLLLYVQFHKTLFQFDYQLAESDLNLNINNNFVSKAKFKTYIRTYQFGTASLKSRHNLL